MSVAAANKKSTRKMFHATMLVTRETAEEARQLLSVGDGHKCHVGDRLHVELRDLVD
jgi:hypothetical protein